MSSPNCPTIKFIIQAVGDKDSDLFDRFNQKMKNESRFKSRVLKFFIEEVLNGNIKLPTDTINRRERKRIKRQKNAQ